MNSMPYSVRKSGDEYIVTAKDTGKTYHTKNPKKLERLHEYYKHKEESND